MRPLEEKAIRLVMEGRVTLRWHNEDYSAGSGLVDGDTDTYQASFDPSGRMCTCLAGSNHRDCSHAVAMELEAQRMREQIAV